MSEDGMRYIIGPGGDGHMAFKTGGITMVDGQMYTHAGNVAFGGNGKTYTQIGNTILGSDGSCHLKFGDNPTLIV